MLDLATGAHPGEERREAVDSCNDLYLLFANLLEYPTPELKQQVDDCIGLLAEVNPQAGEVLAGFRVYVEQTSLKRLEEIYTNTFDLQGLCYPYVGHHLFGESYKRSWFMSQLNRSYREKGFQAKKELPDHVAVILRFLAQSENDEFNLVLLDEGLIPAVSKMDQVFGAKTDHPYKLVIHALSMLLEGSTSLHSKSLAESKEGG